jgi:hypothetical protein
LLLGRRSRFVSAIRDSWKSNGPPLGAAARGTLVLLFACFFPAALAGQRFFHPLLLTRFQVKGVTLDLLDDVFLLHLALEATQCVLEGLALLKSDFCQLNYTPKLVPFGPDSYCKVPTASQVNM